MTRSQAVVHEETHLGRRLVVEEGALDFFVYVDGSRLQNGYTSKGGAIMAGIRQIEQQQQHRR